MKYIIISFIIITQSINVTAQKEGNIWCFGDSALIDWNDPENPTFGRSASKNRGSASSISDSLGNLLFYVGNYIPTEISDCTYDEIYEYGYVYTKEHTIMENGNCLSGEGWYNEHTIIPMPGNDSLYYKFSVNLYDHSGIDYSIVDMKANGGLGKVIERDVSLVSYESDFTGYSPVAWTIKAIRHGNGRDWWLMAKSTSYNADIGPDLFFLLILVTPDGIELQEVPVSETIPQYSLNLSSIGFNKEGTRMFSLSPAAAGDDLFVYDFDRCTGLLSNQINIEDVYDSIGVSEDLFDVEFSPNGRYLYVVNYRSSPCDSIDRYFVFQYDLLQDNPALTRDTLINRLVGNVFDEEGNSIDITYWGGYLELAPDGKIYHTHKTENCADYWWPYPDTLYNYINMNLSVINNPDSAYPNCNYEEFSFSLGGARTYNGLPNNPNFALGAVEGACDTTVNGLKNSQKFLNTNLNIFPNPCYNNCQIQYKPANQKGSIVITNIEGKVIFTESEIPISLLKYGYEINTSAFAKGVYFVTLVSGGHNVTKKLVRL